MYRANISMNNYKLALNRSFDIGLNLIKVKQYISGM